MRLLRWSWGLPKEGGLRVKLIVNSDGSHFAVLRILAMKSKARYLFEQQASAVLLRASLIF